MAKKQTRRSISVSRVTYERLKAFCEANNVSMSQLVETRVNDFLGDQPAGVPRDQPDYPGRSSGTRPTLTITPSAPAPRPHSMPSPTITPIGGPPKQSTSSFEQPQPRPQPMPVPMTSAAARIAVEPPPPIIKPRPQEPAPSPTEKRPDQIFTF